MGLYPLTVAQASAYDNWRTRGPEEEDPRIVKLREAKCEEIRALWNEERKDAYAFFMAEIDSAIEHHRRNLADLDRRFKGYIDSIERGEDDEELVKGWP